MVAFLIDSVILIAVSCPLGVVFGVVAVATGAEEDSTWMAFGNLFVNLVSILVDWLYFSLLESSRWQATLGKKMLGLTVTDLNGNRLTFGKATGRYFAKILSSLILFIGFIMVAFTERKQGLHDQIAGTLVLRKPPTGVALVRPPPPPEFRVQGGTLGIG